ncbi:DUF536 domain-containing protein [Moritella sp.]
MNRTYCIKAYPLPCTIQNQTIANYKKSLDRQQSLTLNQITF